MKRLTVMLALAAVFIISASGQDFMNLDFESAYDLPANPGSGTLISVTNALPSWSCSLLNIYYISNSLGTVSGPVRLEGGSLALSGNFSVGLYLDGSIRQTGLVPADAESLQFEAEDPKSNPGTLVPSDLTVTLGGQSLIYSLLSEGPNYSIYGANIPSNLDGQTEALAFACEGPGSGNVLLDNIEFSTTGVPEPAEFGLIAVGVVLFGVMRRRSWLTAPSFAEAATEGRKST